MQAWLGLGLIFLSYVFLDETKAYPGLWALAPVLGAVLVIHANASAGWMRHPLVAWTGKLSYSLYLWHWPVAVFATYAGLLHPVYTPVWLVVSAGLAWVSFACVEEPFRRQSQLPVRKIVAGYILAIAFLYGLASFVHNKEGFVSRVPAHMQGAQDALTSVYPRQKECMQSRDGCLIGAAAPAQVVLWGDSHADALAPAFEQAVTTAGVAGRIFSLSACPPVPDWVPHIEGNAFRGWSLEGCRDFNRHVLEQLSGDTNVRVVIMAANWIGPTRPTARVSGGPALAELTGDARARVLAESFTQAACGLSARGKRVYVVTPVPDMPFGQALSDVKRGFMWLPLSEAVVAQATYEAETQVFRQMVAQAQASCDIGVIDVSEKMCPEGLCRAKAGDSYLYRDGHHLTVEGALLHVGDFSAVMP